MSLGRLRAQIGFHAGSYEGADRANAARLVGALCLLAGLLSLLYLPLDPPSGAIGGVGWAIAAALIAGNLACGVLMLRRRFTPSFNGLLLLSYLGLAEVAVLVWLGGEVDGPYDALFMLWLGTGMGVHPARRALPFLLMTALVAALPFDYLGVTEGVLAEYVADFLLFSSIGLILLALMTYVRAQRVALRAERERAEEIARADPLTDLGNRRGFDEALTAELARSRRADSVASVVLIDLDHLKQINDELSHLEGDRCLRQVAEAVAAETRAGDRAFRWGGDEFAVLLPDSGYEAAQDAAVRIAARVATTCSDARGHPLTISWGAADAPAGIEAEELLDRADLNLREQKHRKLSVEGPVPEEHGT
jgi:diguanylate cyclase (GGDEF)-like protein